MSTIAKQMASASLRCQTLSPILGSNSLSQSSSATCTRLSFIATNQKSPHYLGTTATISHSTRRPVQWKPLCAKKPSQPGEKQKQGDVVPLSPQSDLIQRFYSSVNKKDLSRLEKLLSKDCTFEDLSYSKRLEGKRIQQFLKQLTQAMGNHVRFVVEGVYEGKELTSAVMWHLEWKNEFIPLTRGCSFFKCSKSGELLLIKEARVFVESPLKPGYIALGMLRIITSLFDKYPRVAQRLLQKRDRVLHYVGIIYKRVLMPVILPLLAYYTNLWVYLARVRRYALEILASSMRKLLKYVVPILLRIISKFM